MKKLFCFLFLVPTLLHCAYAQQALTDTTTWHDTNAKAKHGLAVIKLVDNRTVHAYLPTNAIGYINTIDYFRKNPEVRPFPKIQYIPVNDLEVVEMRGFHLENMRAAGHPDILAMRVLEGPVELFMMSGKITDNLPGVVFVASGLSLFTTAAFLSGAAVENNRWFVRRNGQLIALKHSNFREQMGQYTADCLGISTQVKQGMDGFRYKDTPNIIKLYNEFLQQRATN
ncbi:hypothetical protein F1C16_18790 [Hymenobacter sp. NBH84]|uniref:Uncharacterized protein n=1 Tax=Hymenobacter defluvii TaxID=2054411 RepID=A0ABS3TBY0_9BACT|nr:MULTISPECIES: hypothetical protein [Hymenobacter]MBO3271162.1 hypothetical protein [Hymenobacter defluvii]QNE41462.1 hypothetical protein F1C16_18790 [Hymenobacter sp. NBH84]